MDDYKIEVYAVQSNSTKLTISPNRITLKVAEKDYSKYALEKWESLVYKLKDIPVSTTHRGQVRFAPFGFMCEITTERKNSKFSISYLEQLDSFIWKKVK